MSPCNIYIYIIIITVYINKINNYIYNMYDMYDMYDLEILFSILPFVPEVLIFSHHEPEHVKKKSHGFPSLK